MTTNAVILLTATVVSAVVHRSAGKSEAAAGGTMEKSLRILGLFAVIGAVGLVFGQSVQSSSSARSKQGEQRGSGDAIAQAGGEAKAGAGANVLQNILCYHFSNRQNAEIEAAKVAGKNQLVDEIIKVNCYFTLATKSPAQQKYEIDHVWQTSKWVPNDSGWAAVGRAPSMVKALLNVDPEVARKAQAYWDDETAEWLKPYQEADRRAMATPGFDKMSRTEKNQIIDAENKKVNAGTTSLQRWRRAEQRSLRVAQSARTLLTKEQGTEWDRLIEQYEAEMKRILAGQRPSFINP